MANGDDWEDISDGGDDDWETGKPVAPRSSGSGSGLSGSGSHGSVGTAPTSRHRPQSSWGADDDDWGGDEEDWRPAPVRPSPSNARGARDARSPPRSPALTKGVSPARPAKSTRRWTRSRAACKRLGVLVCLVAAVVTLSSFGIFKGGGSGRGDELWEARPEAFPSSDAFERSARSFGDRATADSSADRFATTVGDDDGKEFGESIDARRAPATRDPAPVQRAVVERVPIAATGVDVPVSRRAADEIARLKASHEHVSNAADALPRRAGQADDDDVAVDALGDFETASDGRGFETRLDRTEFDAVLPGSIAINDGDTEQVVPDEPSSSETGTRDEIHELLSPIPPKEEEDAAINDDDDEKSDSVFGEVIAHEGALPTETRSNFSEEAPMNEAFTVDASSDERTLERPSSEDIATEIVFGEVVDALSDAEIGDVAKDADGVDDGDGGGETVSAEAFLAFGDMLEEASENDAEVMASSGDEHQTGDGSDGEEDGEEDVEETTTGNDALDADSDPKADVFAADGDEKFVPDAESTEEDATKAFEDTSEERSGEEVSAEEGSAEEGSDEEGSEEVSEDDEEASSFSSETRTGGSNIVSKDEASTKDAASSTVKKNIDAPPPPPPPRPPPVPMDGPDMTDPVNRSKLDAYQSREKYVAWSKKAAKLEGRIVAPSETKTR